MQESSSSGAITTKIPTLPTTSVSLSEDQASSSGTVCIPGERIGVPQLVNCSSDSALSTVNSDDDSSPDDIINQITETFHSSVMPPPPVTGLQTSMPSSSPLTKRRKVQGTGKPEFGSTRASLPTPLEDGHGPRSVRECICGRSYRSSSRLIRHLIYFSGKYRQTCVACGRTFLSMSQMKAHQTRHHPAGVHLDHTVPEIVNAMSSCTPRTLEPEGTSIPFQAREEPAPGPSHQTDLNSISETEAEHLNPVEMAQRSQQSPQTRSTDDTSTLTTLDNRAGEEASYQSQPSNETGSSTGVVYDGQGMKSQSSGSPYTGVEGVGGQH